MALPWVPATPNSLVYASSVASWLSQVIGWESPLGLESDSSYYEKFLQDSAISAACDKLQKLVVGHDYFHQPRGGEPQHRLLAKCMDDLTQETEGFSQSLYNIAASSWKGATWAELRLERRMLRIGDGKPRIWTVIAEAKDVDKRRFRLSRAGTSPMTAGRDKKYAGPLRTKWRWEFNRGYGPENTSSSWYVPLSDITSPSCWLLHRVDTSERGLGYGYGLAEDLYFGVYAKAAVLRSLLQGIDRWGQGFLYQKVQGLRMQGSSGLSPEQKIQAVVNTLKKYRSQNVYAIDKDDELDMLDGPPEAINACMQVIQYFDNCHTMRILAATSTSGGGEGAAFAQAKVEEGAEDANVAFLRSPLEERWTLTATRLLVKANRHNLADLRLPTIPLGVQDFLATPRLRLRGRKMADPERAAVVLEMASKLGLPLLRREVYDMLELTQPNLEDDPSEILQPAQIQALVEQRPEVGAQLGAAKEKVAKSIGDRKPTGTAGSSVAQDKGEANALSRLAAVTRG